jgi:hypothetical protein
MGIRCADHATPSIRNVGTTSQTSARRSVGSVRSRTKATESLRGKETFPPLPEPGSPVSISQQPGRSTPGLSNAAPVIYFPGALFYSAGFNVNQNFKEKIFLNNSMFQYFP